VKEAKRSSTHPNCQEMDRLIMPRFFFEGQVVHEYVGLQEPVRGNVIFAEGNMWGCGRGTLLDVNEKARKEQTRFVTSTGTTDRKR